MFNLSNIVQKAQSLIDPTQALNISASDRNPAKSTLFRHQFRLPDSQNPLQEITAELTVSPNITYAANATQEEKERDRDRGYHYVGKLHLSESYLCFSTQPTSFLQTASTTTSSGFTGQTHGAGPGGNGFTLPLCAIRRVERLHSQSYQVSYSKFMASMSSNTQEVCLRYNYLERIRQAFCCRWLETSSPTAKDYDTVGGKPAGLRTIL